MSLPVISPETEDKNPLSPILFFPLVDVQNFPVVATGMSAVPFQPHLVLFWGKHFIQLRNIMTSKPETPPEWRFFHNALGELRDAKMSPCLKYAVAVSSKGVFVLTKPPAPSLLEGDDADKLLCKCEKKPVPQSSASRVEFIGENLVAVFHTFRSTSSTRRNAASLDKSIHIFRVVPPTDHASSSFSDRSISGVVDDSPAEKENTAPNSSKSSAAGCAAVDGFRLAYEEEVINQSKNYHKGSVTSLISLVGASMPNSSVASSMAFGDSVTNVYVASPKYAQQLGARTGLHLALSPDKRSLAAVLAKNRKVASFPTELENLQGWYVGLAARNTDEFAPLGSAFGAAHVDSDTLMVQVCSKLDSSIHLCFYSCALRSPVMRAKTSSLADVLLTHGGEYIVTLAGKTVKLYSVQALRETWVKKSMVVNLV